MISFYEVTTGLNYKANANLIIRPEVKFNWCPAEDTLECREWSVQQDHLRYRRHLHVLTQETRP